MSCESIWEVCGAAQASVVWWVAGWHGPLGSLGYLVETPGGPRGTRGPGAGQLDRGWWRGGPGWWSRAGPGVAEGWQNATIEVRRLNLGCRPTIRTLAEKKKTSQLNFFLCTNIYIYRLRGVAKLNGVRSILASRLGVVRTARDGLHFIGTSANDHKGLAIVTKYVALPTHRGE